MIPSSALFVDQADGDVAFFQKDMTITSFDGTKIQITRFLPNILGNSPAIIMTHGWGGTRGDVLPLAQDYASQGYVVITYDSRGFGESDGEITLNGPLEVMDLRAMVGYVARLPFTTMDDFEARDPKVGLRGVSYAGAIQLLAAAVDPRIDAVVPESTWNDLGHSLAPNDVLKKTWVDLLYASGHMNGNPDGILDDWYRTVNTVGITDEVRDGLAARSPSTVMADIDIPTFVVHGWRDTLFTPLEAVRTYETLRDQGTDARLLMHDGGHGWGIGNDIPHVNSRILEFFNEKLKGQAPVTTPPTVELYNRATGSWDGYTDFPSDNQVRYFLGGSVLSTAGSSPAGALPNTVHNSVAPTSSSEFPNFQSSYPMPSRETPGSSVGFETGKFQAPARVLGTPNMTLYMSAVAPIGFQFFVKLYAYDAAGTATLIQNQVAAMKASPDLGATVPVDVRLSAMDHTVPAGGYLKLVITSTDVAWEANKGSSFRVYHDEDSPSQIYIPMA